MSVDVSWSKPLHHKPRLAEVHLYATGRAQGERVRLSVQGKLQDLSDMEATEQLTHAQTVGWTDKRINRRWMDE